MLEQSRQVQGCLMDCPLKRVVKADSTEEGNSEQRLEEVESDCVNYQRKVVSGRENS